ncbi:MAG: hypothetical protein HKO53_01755, partial [Gemmatimonadetes bacterium]|nr:hypothetical protein [Gemmatimonadota bacterium]
VRLALAKIPADRFATAGALARALQDPEFRIASERQTSVAGDRWARVAAGASAIAVVAAGLALWGFLRTTATAEPASYELYPSWEVGQEPDLVQGPRVAPDGTWMVRGGPGEDGESRIWRKARGEVDWLPVVGTEGGAYPRISPDGRRIAFFDSDTNELRVVPAEGGASSRGTDMPGPFGWVDDESIAVVLGGARLVRVWIDETARTEELWAPTEVGIRGQPEVFEDGSGLLLSTCTTCPIDKSVGVFDLESRQYRVLFPANHAVPFGRNRLILQTSSGDLLAGRIDRATSTLESNPVLIRENVAFSGFVPGFSVSRNGLLLSVEGPPLQADITENLYEAVWVDRQGGESLAAQMAPFQLAFNFGHSLSPDGTKMAIGLNSEEGWDVWIKELPDGPLTRLTLSEANDARPKWSADGQYIWFQSDRDEQGASKLYRRRADGADEPIGFQTPGREVQEPEPVPGGEWMIARVAGASGIANSGRDIVAYRVGGGDTAEVPLLTSQFDEFSPSVSPDGRWLAYVSTESGRPEVYVRPFPDVTTSRAQISVGGGIHPLWKGDGSELYYVTFDEDGSFREMVAARLTATPTLAVQERETLFRLSDRLLTNTPWEPVVDVTADGERFLFMRALENQGEGVRHRLVVIEGFGDEIERALGR